MSLEFITKFVNDNAILREDIINITCVGDPDVREYTIFLWRPKR
jgi:hypothetical protein